MGGVRRSGSHFSAQMSPRKNSLPLLIKSSIYVLSGQEIPGGFVAGTFPETTFFVLLFTRILFMVSQSGIKLFLKV